MDQLDAVDVLVGGCRTEDVPLIVGRLEAAKHRALGRLVVPPTQGRGLMTTNEVADALGVSGDKVRSLVAEGRMVAVKIGRAVRFRPESIEGFVKGLEGRRVKRLVAV